VHDSQDVADVLKIRFPVPTDAFHQVANSGLLNSAQLSSLYSGVGTRVHLALGFTPLMRDRTTRILDDSEALFVQLHHLDRDLKTSPYDKSGETITLKPVFVEWVFEVFYERFIQHVFERLAGTPWAVEFPVYHPGLLVGRSGRLKCPQTFLDAVFRMPDGSLTLVDYKTLMQARPPNDRLRDAKNLRQIVTNAAFFQAMTKVRIQRAALVYITRVGTVTVLTVDLSTCAAVTKHALLSPLARATHRITYTEARYAVNKQVRVEALDDLGAATGTETGVVIPAALRPAPAAPPAAPAAQLAAEEEDDEDEDGSPPPPRRRRSRRLQQRSDDEEGDGQPVVGAMYTADAEAVATAVVDDEDAPAAASGVDGTLAERRAINERLADAAEAVFDQLPSTSKLKLRGRTGELFQYLAASRPLFPQLPTADGGVAPSPPAKLVPADARPLTVQALIRTGQRALNQAVAAKFLRTRNEQRRAEVANDVPRCR